MNAIDLLPEKYNENENKKNIENQEFAKNLKPIKIGKIRKGVKIQLSHPRTTINGDP